MTSNRREVFRDNGFLTLEGAVPRERVDHAVRKINAMLGGAVGVALGTAERDGLMQQWTSMAASPLITGLVDETSVREAAESLAGKLGAAPSGHILPRFPHADDPSSLRLEPHIDEIAPDGTTTDFTVLVAVLLTDVIEPWRGNFTVWPGTHLQHAEYFRETRPAEPPHTPPIDLPEPVQITGRAGDAVLVHHLMAHSGAHNFGPHVRHAVFFRLARENPPKRKWDTLTDAWLEWEGMRDVV